MNFHRILFLLAIVIISTQARKVRIHDRKDLNICITDNCEAQLNFCQQNDECQKVIQSCVQKHISQEDDSQQQFEECIKDDLIANNVWQCIKANCLHGSQVDQDPISLIGIIVQVHEIQKKNIKNNQTNEMKDCVEVKCKLQLDTCIDDDQCINQLDQCLKNYKGKKINSKKALKYLQKCVDSNSNGKIVLKCIKKQCKSLMGSLKMDVSLKSFFSQK